MAPGGIKAREKSALAVQPVPRVTRSGKSFPPSEVLVTTVSVPHAGLADENVGNCDEHTHPLNEGKFYYQLNC